MATAQELINSAAKFAGILAEGQALESGINTDALNRLNRMLDRFQNDGVDLGLGVLTATSEIYVDLADEEALELSLAMRLMARHRRPIMAGLPEAAASAFTELQAKYTVLPTMDLDLGLVRAANFDITRGD